MKKKGKVVLKIAMLVALTLFSIVWGALLSPRMINRIELNVIGLDKIPNEIRNEFQKKEIEQRAWRLIKSEVGQRHLEYYFFSSIERLKAAIQEDSFFEFAEIRRSLNFKLSISVQPRIPLAMTLMSDGRWGWVDQKGIAFLPISQKIPNSVMGWVQLESFHRAGVFAGPWIFELKKNFGNNWDDAHIDTNERLRVKVIRRKSETVSVEFLVKQKIKNELSQVSDVTGIDENRTQVSDLKRTLEVFDQRKIVPRKIQFTSDKKMVVRTFDGS